MKAQDVPQDNDKNYEGHLKLRYGRDENGHMKQVGSTGCAIEQGATSIAWDDITSSLEETLTQVLSGSLSPLAYHIEKKLMTYDLLAENLGLWKWQVKRHLKPAIFKKISQKQLKLYADYLEISVEDLLSVPGRKI